MEVWKHIFFMELIFTGKQKSPFHDFVENPVIHRSRHSGIRSLTISNLHLVYLFGSICLNCNVSHVYFACLRTYMCMYEQQELFV